MKRNSYLSRNKSKNSSKNAIQRNSRRRPSIICINKVHQNIRITPTIPIFFNKTPSTNLQRKKERIYSKKNPHRKRNTQTAEICTHIHPKAQAHGRRPANRRKVPLNRIYTLLFSNRRHKIKNKKKSDSAPHTMKSGLTLRNN